MKDTSNALTPDLDSAHDDDLRAAHVFPDLTPEQALETLRKYHATRDAAATLEAALKERDERIAELERDNNDMTALESQVERAERAEAERDAYYDDYDRCQKRLMATQASLATLVAALERIGMPKRPDGTYNLSREACRVVARSALATVPSRPE